MQGLHAVCYENVLRLDELDGQSGHYVPSSGSRSRCTADGPTDETDSAIQSHSDTIRGRVLDMPSGDLHNCRTQISGIA